MMRNSDPLDTWVFAFEAQQSHSDAETSRLLQAQQHGMVHRELDRLTAALDNPGPKGPDLYKGAGLQFAEPVILTAADRARVMDSYRRVLESGGAGSTYAQEGLLRQLGAAADPAAISFWQEMLALARPHDRFATTRRRYATAALAWVAMRHPDSAAVAALRAALGHENADVRGFAATYLVAIYTAVDRPVPEDVLADVAALATRDGAFGARYRARRALREAGAPAPPDNPAGVYVLRVRYPGIRHMSRTLELQPQNTLEDLHLAIQHAIHWDNDHLYAFHMDGKRGEEEFEIPCPHMAEDHSMPRMRDLAALILGRPERSTRRPERENAPVYSTAWAAVGELGLTLKHKFVYLFDFGDNHEFEVQVTAIRPQAAPGAYPRLVASEGPAPRQYRSWGDEDDGWDEAGKGGADPPG